MDRTMMREAEAPGVATAPGGHVHVRVGGLGRRALAASIDGALLLPVVAACAVLVRLVVRTPLPSSVGDTPSYVMELVVAGHPMAATVAILATVLWLLYQFFFAAFAGGTPGLRATGLALVDASGAAPGMGTAVLRTVALILATAPLGLGLLWIGFDREKRGLHDHLSGTYVVRQPFAVRR